MAVTFVTEGHVAAATSTTTTVVPMPACAVGDKLVAVVASIAASATVTAPAGWAAVGDQFAPTTGLRSAVFVRIADGTEPGSYTWTWSVAGRTFGAIVAHNGAGTAAPVVAVKAGTADSAGPHTAPGVTVPDGGLLITVGVGRQSPGTAGAVTWTINQAGDTERIDVTATNTGTGAQLTSAWYSTNNPVVASTGSPTSGPPPLIKYNQLWAASGAMRVGVTVKKDELTKWKNRFTGLDWMRVFPDGDGLPPDWSDSRFEFIRGFGGEVFVSTKIDGDAAKLKTLKAWMLATPSWVTRLWYTDRHEPEGDISAAKYKANSIKAFDMVASIADTNATLRNKIWEGHALTRQWTDNTSGRTYKTHDTGRGRYLGCDMYMNSYQSGNTAATKFVDVAAFLSKFGSYRYDSSDVRPRLFPELGGIGIPDDPTGELRAAWMQQVQDYLVANWTQAKLGFPFLGWIWWGTEGKSGDSVARIGTRRWFTLDRHHNSKSYTYTVYNEDTKKNETRVDPIGSFDLIPDVAGSGGGSVPAGRQVTASALLNTTHVWSIALAPGIAPAPTASSWSSVGVLPLA